MDDTSASTYHTMKYNPGYQTGIYSWNGVFRYFGFDDNYNIDVSLLFLKIHLSQ